MVGHKRPRAPAWGALGVVVGDLGVGTIGDAVHLDLQDATTVGTGSGTNVRLVLTPRKGS